MSIEDTIARYRRWYRQLLHLHTRSHRERFGESMEQTFTDLCRERVETGKNLSAYVLWLFGETLAELIRAQIGSNMMSKKAVFRIAVVTVSILLAPFVAMRFTDEVAWDLTDFVVGGVLLSGAGLAYELLCRKGGSTTYRAAVAVAVLTALFLVWMNLAVGLIGNEQNPANLLYAGVLLVGLIGVYLARFHAREMARALFATALAQLLVPVIAMMIWRPSMSAGLVGVFGVNTLFVMMWVVSALLFRHAGHPWPNVSGESQG